MPLLTDALAASYFETGEWRACLYLNGVEQASVTPTWTVVGAVASCRPVFVSGVFLRFDELVVERDGTAIDRYGYGGVVAVPPGMEWAHDLTITMTEA